MSEIRRPRRGENYLLKGAVAVAAAVSAQAVVTLPVGASAKTAGPTKAEVTEAYKLSEQAFNNFGDKLIKQHEAKVFYGTCMGWLTTSGTVTVTVNPGIAKAEKDNVLVAGFVASSAEPLKGMSPNNFQIALTNGPFSGYIKNRDHTYDFNDTNQGNMLVYDLSPGIKAGPKEVTVSKMPITESDGISAYIDQANGQPVISSETIEGPLNQQTVLATCRQLPEVSPAQGPITQT